jgi:uncharacterized protein
LALSLLGPFAAAVAASFECKEASTAVEKMICATDELSELDEFLDTAYGKALSDVEHETDVTNAQVAWLKNVRDKCKDVVCLRRVYIKRIFQLEPRYVPEIPDKKTAYAPKRILTGRCHMLTCWWWGIDKEEIIKESPREELIKLTLRIPAALVREIDSRKP